MCKDSRKKKERREQREVAPRARVKETEKRANRKKLPKWKLILLSLTPAFFLLLTAEGVTRILVSGGPEVKTLPLPEEQAGLFKLDQYLFWKITPNLNLSYMGAPVRTNSWGLRNEEFGDKEKNEFRILSLGESSTFGVGVANGQTYTALLEENLQALHPEKHIRTLNGGVSAYSSFQSLTALKRNWTKLDPDVVVFYHEVNDYLPSTLRDSSQKEIGVMKTDKQLYDSRTQWMSRNLMEYSALFRFLLYSVANRKIKSFNEEKIQNHPLENVGLPAIGIPPRLRKTEGDKTFTSARTELFMGQRVSEEERKWVLGELSRYCEKLGIKLVVVHPSYGSSKRHECLLTQVCAEKQIAMFDAYDTLHPKGLAHTALYLDSWHPNRQGHQRLGKALADFVHNRFLSN